MNQATEKLQATGLTQHDLDQFKKYFAVSLTSKPTPEIKQEREAAIQLLKNKLHHGQVFFEVSQNRDGISKLYFLGWIKLIDGSEVAVFQNRHLVENRANLFRDLRDVDNAPLTGYYLTRDEAEAALADLYKRKLDALTAKQGCGCGIDHDEEHSFAVPGA